MPNYNIDILGNLDLSKLRQNGFKASQQGAMDYGKALQPALSGIAQTIGQGRAVSKADQLLAEYNNPQSAIFTGLEGGQRTRKLGRLLLPVDQGMSNQYLKLADDQDAKSAAAGQDIALMKQKGLNDIELEKLKGLNPEPAKPADREKAIATRANLAQQVLSGGVPVETAVAAFNRDYPYSMFGVEFKADDDMKALAGAAIAPTAEAGYTVGQGTKTADITKGLEGAKQAKIGTAKGQYEVGGLMNKTDGGLMTSVSPANQAQFNAAVESYDKIQQPLIAAVEGSAKALQQIQQSKSADGSISGLPTIEAIYGFLKSIDPTSAVREGEVALFAGSQSLYDKIMSKVEGGMLGETLQAGVVSDLEKSIKRAMDRSEDRLASEEKLAKSRLKMYKFDDQSFSDYFPAPTGWKQVN